MDEETRLVPAQLTSALEDADVDTKALTPIPVEDLPKIIDALEVLAKLIPDLRKPDPATAGKVRGARTVSRAAVASIVAMVESCPAVQGPLDVERAHEVLGSNDTYRLVGERADILKARIKYTAEARWAETVQEAMAAFYMAKRLVKLPQHKDLAAHVEIISGHLDRRNGTTGKKRKKKGEPDGE